MLLLAGMESGHALLCPRSAPCCVLLAVSKEARVRHCACCGESSPGDASLHKG